MTSTRTMSTRTMSTGTMSTGTMSAGMTSAPLSRALAVALLGTLALAACKKDAPAPATPPARTEPAPLPPVATPAPATSAASITSVELGNAVGADMRVATPMSTFATTDTIHVSVATATTDPAATVPATLGAKWTHLDSNQVVQEETEQVNLSANGVTSFRISNPDGWPTGRYRVDVTLDGAAAQSREFEVR